MCISTLINHNQSDDELRRTALSTVFLLRRLIVDHDNGGLDHKRFQLPRGPDRLFHNGRRSVHPAFGVLPQIM